MQTYNIDKQVPDSAGTATAIFSGVKCRYRVLGLDSKASYDHCDKNIDETSKVTTVADWAQQTGMDTGKYVPLLFSWCFQRSGKWVNGETEKRKLMKGRIRDSR